MVNGHGFRRKRPQPLLSYYPYHSLGKGEESHIQLVLLSLTASYWPSRTLPRLILTAYIYVPFPSAIHFTLKTEAAWPSETLVSYITARPGLHRCLLPQSHSLHPEHRRSMVLWNVGITQNHNTASRSRTTRAKPCNVSFNTASSSAEVRIGYLLSTSDQPVQ